MGINVLSEFDGMACGLVALKRLGVPVDNYYASEVDEHCMAVARKNHPEIKHIKPVGNLLGAFAPGKIDLFLAGFPCQAWSRAGREKGFEDPRGRIVLDMIQDMSHLRAINPKMKIILECTSMKPENREFFDHCFRMKSVLIDSCWFSAQRRRRLYWASFGIPEMSNNYRKFEDILVPMDECKDLKLSEKGFAYMNRRVKDGRNHWDFQHHSDTRKMKSATLVANLHKGVPYNTVLDFRHYGDPAMALARHYHPLECERLMGLPGGYTSSVKKTHRLKMLGNGWQVDTIVHILKGIFK